MKRIWRIMALSLALQGALPLQAANAEIPGFWSNYLGKASQLLSSRGWETLQNMDREEQALTGGLALLAIAGLLGLGYGGRQVLQVTESEPVNSTSKTEPKAIITHIDLPNSLLEDATVESITKQGLETNLKDIFYDISTRLDKTRDYNYSQKHLYYPDANKSELYHFQLIIRDGNVYLTDLKEQVQSDKLSFSDLNDKQVINDFIENKLPVLFEGIEKKEIKQ